MKKENIILSGSFSTFSNLLKPLRNELKKAWNLVFDNVLNT